MKYIRTKNGVYEVVCKEDKLFIISTSKSDTSTDWIHEDDVIEQANSIEGLCDGVIEICLSGNRFIPISRLDKEDAIRVKNIPFNKGYKEFYFGIYVEGENKVDFISVAKMNQEGVLELL